MRSLPFLAILLAVAPLAAQQDRLGTASFPNSGNAAAQPEFMRGLLLLHSFEYGQAATAFRAAQQADPAFAMAYWGEAMTYTHPIWNEQDTAAALTALRRFAPTAEARAARTPTERERAWLTTVEQLYSTGTKAHRDTLYEQAVERLVARYPKDDEARAFEALALMGLSQGIRDVPTYEKAGAIALDLFKRYPDHPGAAHYVIHAFDDPAHASRALPAARAYSKIAPGAAHAQHMTTHIFLALGMWPEVVAQNIVASGPDTSKWLPGHYTAWLGYGLLQQGDTAAAAHLLQSLRDHMAQTGARRTPALIEMIGELVINGERWSDGAMAWPVDEQNLYWLARVTRRFTVAFAAIQRGQVDSARARYAEVAAIADSVPADLEGGLDRAQAGIMALQLEALLARAGGDTAGAITRLERAAVLEDSLPAEFGPPTVQKPSYELLGEVLLAAGRPADAARSFQRALALAPGRRLSLRGLAAARGKAS
jgi:tetratricopeptide (TPR) repeat protein